MNIICESVLRDRVIPGLGNVIFRVEDKSRNVVVFVSKLHSIGNLTRSHPSGHQKLYRISVYSMTSNVVLGYRHECYEITSIALHPTEDRVYFGVVEFCEHYFYGELWAFDWREKRAERVLPDSMYVIACDFDKCNNIRLLLSKYRQGRREIRTIASLPVPNFGSDRGADVPKIETRSRVDAKKTLSELGFDQVVRTEENGEKASIVFDVAWIDDDQIIVVGNGVAVEIINVRTGAGTVLLSEGNGVEVLVRNGQVLVNVFTSGKIGTGWLKDVIHRSEIFILRSDHLEPYLKFEFGCSISCDMNGRLFVRNCSYRDDICHCIVGVDEEKSWIHSEGGYGAFRLNGGSELYFLDRDPKSRSNAKLKGIDESLNVSTRYDWNTEQNLPPGDVSACISNDLIVIGFHDFGDEFKMVGDFKLGFYDLAKLELISLKSGKCLWHRLFVGHFTAIAFVSECNVIALAHINGVISLVDVENGDVLDAVLVNASGVESVVTCMSVRGRRLVAGTQDGRVLMFLVKGDIESRPNLVQEEVANLQFYRANDGFTPWLRASPRVRYFRWFADSH